MVGVHGMDAQLWIHRPRGARDFFALVKSGFDLNQGLPRLLPRVPAVQALEVLLDP